MMPAMTRFPASTPDHDHAMSDPHNSDRAHDEAHATDRLQTRLERTKQRRGETSTLPHQLQSLVDARREHTPGPSTDSPRVTVEETPQGRIVTYHKSAADAAAAREETNSTDSNE